MRSTRQGNGYSLARRIPELAIAVTLAVACSVPASLTPRSSDLNSDWAVLRWQMTFGDKGFGQTIILTKESLITFLRSDRHIDQGIGGTLLAINRETGQSQWGVPVPFVESDVLLLLTDEKLVFAITGEGASAYNLKGGGMQWTSTLGLGHVQVGALLDGQLIRVYYGETAFEIDKSSGTLISQRPIASTLWQIGVIELKRDGSSEISAHDVVTAKRIWSAKLEQFRIDEPWTPQPAGAQSLIVHPTSGKMGDCALDLATGQVSWCTEDVPISNIAIDQLEQTGWYIRNDLVLVGLDLTNGAILRSLQFEPPTLPESMKRQRFEYRVAAHDGAIAILFGDTNQVFMVAED